MHEAIERKLDGFYRNNRIPNLLFHGAHGTGKRTLVYNFINLIYDHQKPRIKTNVMFVNCAHGKGIKFIREELKFFAKTNIKGHDVRFKTIVLFQADSLTIDAQSALRRCIELFSYNTRFFIVVENKHRLLNPIVSRFCEIYVPETSLDPLDSQNLHRQRLQTLYSSSSSTFDWKEQLGRRGCPPRTHSSSDETSQVKTDGAVRLFANPKQLLECVHDAYESGESAITMIDWIRKDLQRIDIVVHFYRIKSEYRCEKMLMFCLLTRLFEK